MKSTDLIDGYLQKSLSNEELIAFEEALVNDPNFGREFQELKEIQLGVKTSTRRDIKSFLNEIEEDIEQSESTQNFYNMKRVIAVAASIALIATISFFALNQTTQPSLQEIYTINFSHYENLNGQVRGENESWSLESQASRAYDMGNYSLAAATYAELVKTDKSANNYFYMGLSNLESGNFKEAINNLNSTINNFDAFDKQAKWYLSLAHLANDSEEDAVATLISLTIENSTYKEKAESILKEMGLTWNSFDFGIIDEVRRRPKEDTPNGSFDEFIDARQWQFGVVISESNGFKYRFLTDEPIDDLEVGSEVEMIVVRKNRRRKSGFAFILGKN